MKKQINKQRPARPAVPKLMNFNFFNEEEKKQIKQNMFQRQDVDLYLGNEQLKYEVTQDKKLLGMGITRKQRKLILSEILFLTNMDAKEGNVLYIGAAPGKHIFFLSKMFPNLKFFLFDNQKFDVRETANIKIYNKLFKKEDIKDWVERTDYFISDIVTKNKKSADVAKEIQFEGNVIADQELQKYWVQELSKNQKFKQALLRFRIPYSDNLYEYLDGKIYQQAWSGQFSGELRLQTRGESLKLYKLQDMENKCYYKNLIQRGWIWYKHDIRIKSVDHCFDCAYEIKVLTQYFCQFFPELKKDKDDLRGKVIRLMLVFSRFLEDLNYCHHGYKPNEQMFLKWNEIQKQFQYCIGK